MVRALILIFIAFLGKLFLASPTQFNKQEFYRVMSQNSVKDIDLQLKKLQSLKQTEAFTGALQMKKAEIISQPSEKLSLFQSGQSKLEKAIQSDTTVVEWRFLRLMIQEHAPKLMNYHQSIKKDAQYIRTHYQKLPEPALEALYRYCNKSQELKGLVLSTTTHE